MVVLGWGNELILASSQKGPQSFSYDGPDTPVKHALQICQATWQGNSPTSADRPHRTQGKCAEEMAAQLYYMFNQAPLKDQQARPGAWVGHAKRPDEPEKTDPCGDTKNDIWGCNLFVENQGLRVLDKNNEPQPYDRAKDAGGIRTKNQYQLCGALRN